MIQEISDYLWIRDVLLCTDGKELIASASDKENFANIIYNISELMQKEDFVLVFNYIIGNIEELVYHYRFDYNKDKEINDNMNYIIGRLNAYKNMSEERKNYLCKSWVKDEFNDRLLPITFRNADNLVDLMQLDVEYITGMLNYSEPFEIENVIEYLSLINLTINRFPDSFKDEDFYKATYNNLEGLKELEILPYNYKCYVKKTIKNLKKVETTNLKEEKKIKIKRKIF